MLSVRAFLITASTLAIVACTEHGPPESAEPQPMNGAPPPVMIVEAEPARPIPPIVAAPLPPLPPTHPLAHFAPLWHHLEREGPRAQSFIAVGTTPLALSSSEAEQLGLASAAVELGKIEPARMNALEWAGPMLVLGTKSSFAAAEPPAKLAWLIPDLPASYTYAITPRLLLAPLYEAKGDRLTAWALADGREHWSERGLGKFTRIKQLWADDERAYVLSDAGLLVLELLDGELLWQTNTLGSDCGVAVGEGLLVIEDPTGHQIVEAASGKRIAQLPVPSRSPRCAWEGYDDYGVAPGVIADGRLYAFDTEQGEHPQALRAFDLATRAELWHAEGFGDQVLAVDQDAVYIERGEIDLIALDSGTGKQQAVVAIGAPFTVQVEPVGGAAGPLVVVTDEFAGAWILGRTEAAPVPESFVISGRLVPSGMDRKRVAGVRVRVGDRIVKTDKRGRFEARGQAIGAIVVEPADNPWEYDYGDLDEPPVVIETRRVLLDGEGKYDLGEIEAFEVPLA